jgi:hypothetical protein
MKTSQVKQQHFPSLDDLESHPVFTGHFRVVIAQAGYSSDLIKLKHAA